MHPAGSVGLVERGSPRDTIIMLQNVGSGVGSVYFRAALGANAATATYGG